MRITILALGLALVAAPGAPASQVEDLGELQRQLDALQTDYQQRIQDLETRLARAEAAAADAQARAKAAETTATEVANAPLPVAAPSSAANAFNPAMSVILDGKLREFDRDPGDFRIPGFAFGEEAGPGDEGLSVGESEIDLSANIDDKFYGALTVPVVEEDGETKVELEEAYLQTLALPKGLTFKAGRFFSGVGYLNGFHAHADDFADRPLPYRAFLNMQYGDDGLQIRWIAPTDLFVEVGVEVFRGNSFPSGGAVDEGKGAWSVFGHAGGDVGASHSWRAGLSYLSGQAEGRATGDEDDPDGFSGDSDLLIADFVWKWAPNGNPAIRNFKLQGEYFYRTEDGRFTPAGGAALALDSDQSGWYAQGIYQFMPQWRFGLRYSMLEADDPGLEFIGTVLDDGDHSPRMLSAMLDWSNSEFSRIRLQYNLDDIGFATDNQVLLQYVMSIGAHGAHQF